VAGIVKTIHTAGKDNPVDLFTKILVAMIFNGILGNTLQTYLLRWMQWST
jgi:hypothetical protein